MAMTLSLYTDSLLPETHLTPSPEALHCPSSPSISSSGLSFPLELTDASGFYPGELSDLTSYLGDSELSLLNPNNEKNREKGEWREGDKDLSSSFWTSAVTNWEKVDRQIWRLTHEYLTRVKGYIDEASNPLLIAPISSIATPVERIFPPSEIQCNALLLHAFQASAHSFAQSQNPKSVNKSYKKSHTKVRLFLQAEKCHQPKKAESDSKIVFRTKAKTGRKPKNYECFKCHMNLPYKRNLIYHLRDEHHIYRSQSLLYKRLNQDPAEMKRLYGGPI